MGQWKGGNEVIRDGIAAQQWREGIRKVQIRGEGGDLPERAGV